MSEQTNYTPYVQLTAEEKYGKLCKIQECLRKFAVLAGIDLNSISCHREVLLDVVDRVEKRKVYFQNLYGNTMSEKRETALYCFWIVKLAPFFTPNNPENHFSVIFASHIFLDTIEKIGHSQKPSLNIKFDKDYTDRLVHAFLYWDLSEEAIIMIAETLLRRTPPSA